MLKTRSKKKEGNERLNEIEFEIKKIDDEIDGLNTRRKVLQEEALNIHIAPFKVGEYAIVEVPVGRAKKEKKCLLECEGRLLYVRPVNEDGSLSGRHFLIFPHGERTYADLLKKC